MSSFWKNLFKNKSIESDENKDESYELDWRNRYLEARLEHLTKKLQKSGKFLPSQPALPSDIEGRNRVLAETVKSFEAALKR